VLLRRDGLADLPDTVGDVADHFDLREVHGVHRRRNKVDVDDLQVFAAHEERRFLDHVVPDVQDQVGMIDGTVDEIVVRKGRVAQEQRVAFIDHSFAHLCREERDPRPVDESAQHPARDLAIGAGAHQQQRVA